MYKNIKIREMYLVYLIFIVDKDTWEIQEKNSQVLLFFPKLSHYTVKFRKESGTITYQCVSTACG